MAAPERAVTTAEELIRLPTGMGERYELIHGEMKIMSPAGSRHGRIAAQIGSLLNQYVRAHGLGDVFGAETGFILRRTPDTVRAPDAAFVAAGRVPAEGLPEGFFPGAPDLAVEVVSPDDRAAEVQRKVADYLEAGTRLVWVIYPGTRQVQVFTSQRQIQVFSAGEDLEGGECLPGFRCPVSEIFD